MKNWTWSNWSWPACKSVRKTGRSRCCHRDGKSRLVEKGLRKPKPDLSHSRNHWTSTDQSAAETKAAIRQLPITPPAIARFGIVPPWDRQSITLCP